MPKLYGESFTKRDLLRHIGDISQAGGVKRYWLAEGKAAGTEAVDFRTGGGLNFTVLPGRGMDISFAEYRGIPLCWRSCTGDVSPAFFEPQGLGWLRGFFGGLLTTCGLSYLGEPCIDQGEPLGLHGRISNIPAQNVLADGHWEGESYTMWIRGKIRETAALGENICLTRKISAKLGENKLKLEDTVENLGFEKTPHMILYHINGGFPVVAEGSELICPVASFQPRDEQAKIEMERYNRFLPPAPGFKERVYYLDLNADPQGYTYAALVNRGFGNGKGIGFYIKYKKQQLPVLVEWKMNGEGCYVVGIEPANCRVEGRAKARESGELEFLEPSERRRYEIEIGVLASNQQISQFEEIVKEIKQA
ncbi:MAG: hypothetical protein B1H40_00780 [Candidatus Latescibacteria bacterium 4484_181]|nr:MAG: hypothetical protein B1H40_00780 [Candidatus Latescibacteria bacterium 4484_181]RKY68458.1 MAG: DUF4432 domain-containing protein [Candidatus Latescibacterota bacterium]